MPQYKPRSAPVEAFRYKRGVKHPVLSRTEYHEHPGGPPYGDDDVVPIGHRGEMRAVKSGEYVIVMSDGLCKVMDQVLFEAIYELAES